MHYLLIEEIKFQTSFKKRQRERGGEITIITWYFSIDGNYKECIFGLYGLHFEKGKDQTSI